MEIGQYPLEEKMENSDICSDMQLCITRKRQHQVPVQTLRTDRMPLADCTAIHNPYPSYTEQTLTTHSPLKKTEQSPELVVTQLDCSTPTRSNQIAELFNETTLGDQYDKIKRDILDKVNPGTSKELIQWLIENYEEEEAPKPKRRPVNERRRSRRLTADALIMDQGYLQSPSPEDQKVSENTAPRRSKRLRTSLAVYREQQILPDNLACTEPIRLVAVTGEVEPNSTQNLSPMCAEPAIEIAVADIAPLDTTTAQSMFTEPVSPTLTFQLENLYRNKNYVAPCWQPLPAILESPKGNRLFSVQNKTRVFDFTEGAFYHPTPAKTSHRRKLAKRQGWKTKTGREHKQYEHKLSDRLEQLDLAMISD